MDGERLFLALIIGAFVAFMAALFATSLWTQLGGGRDRSSS